VKHEREAFHTCDWCGARTTIFGEEDPWGEGLHLSTGADLCAGCVEARAKALDDVKRARARQ
jgi:hypothetical protein